MQFCFHKQTDTRKFCHVYGAWQLSFHTFSPTLVSYMRNCGSRTNDTACPRWVPTSECKPKSDTSSLSSLTVSLQGVCSDFWTSISESRVGKTQTEASTFPDMCTLKRGGYKHSSRVTYKCLLQSLVSRELYVNVAWMKEGRLCYDPVPCGPIKNQGLSWQLTKPEFFVEMESWGKNSYTGETWDQKTFKTLPNQPLKTNLTVEIRVSQKY